MTSDLDFSLEPIFSFNYSVNPWVIAEIFLIAVFLMYTIYAALIVKQVYIMDKALSTGVSFYLKFFTWIHFIATVIAFVVIVVNWF